MLTLCGFAASNYYNKVKLALLEKGGTTRAFVVENGVAKQRTLKVVATNADYIYAEGVRAGETVVIRGQDLLSDGQPVRILEP